MTEAEVKRIEELALEIKKMLPKYSHVCVQADEPTIGLNVLEEDFPRVNEVVEGEPYERYGKTFTPLHETIGNVVVGGVRL